MAAPPPTAPAITAVCSLLPLLPPGGGGGAISWPSSARSCTSKLPNCPGGSTACGCKSRVLPSCWAAAASSGTKVTVTRSPVGRLAASVPASLRRPVMGTSVTETTGGLVAPELRAACSTAVLTCWIKAAKLAPSARRSRKATLGPAGGGGAEGGGVPGAAPSRGGAGGGGLRAGTQENGSMRYSARCTTPCGRNARRHLLRIVRLTFWTGRSAEAWEAGVAKVAATGGVRSRMAPGRCSTYRPWPRTPLYSCPTRHR